MPIRKSGDCKLQERNKRDIFDKLMSLPVLNTFEPFYQKHKEVLLYLFFGGLTFVISIASYAFFNISMKMNELIANLFSWVIAVLFAYITNRTWVFENTGSGTAGVLKEVMLFMSGRVVTLVLEEVILLVFITWMHFDSMLIKVIGQVVVIVSNYFISKLVVFKGK